MTRVFGFSASFARQPGHVFFALRCAWHTAQFNPHGAINLSLLSFVSIVFMFPAFQNPGVPETFPSHFNLIRCQDYGD
jgi:hypothetical protein